MTPKGESFLGMYLGTQFKPSTHTALRFEAAHQGKAKNWRKRLRNAFLTLGLVGGSIVGGGGYMVRYHFFQHDIDGTIGDRFEKGVATYRSPTSVEGYVNNPQSVPYHRGAFSNMFPFLSPLAQLERIRAEFNRTHDLNLFNSYLRYRTSLLKDPKRLKAHDAKIEAFVNHPNVEFGFVDKNGKAWELDKSTKYLFAARLLDLLHNREDLLNHIIERDKPLRVAFFQELHHPNWFEKGSYVVGHYAVGNGDITFNHDTFWHSIAYPSINGTLDIHEVTHAIDAKDYGVFSWLAKAAIADGTLPGLSAEDEATWHKERERLSSTFETKGNDSGLGEYAVGHIKPDLPVIGEVAVRRRWEFVAEAVAIFYDNPNVLHKASPQLYDILKRYFRMDPLNGYRDAEP